MKNIIDQIRDLPPTYPQIGHQYVFGFNDGKHAAAEMLEKTSKQIINQADAEIIASAKKSPIVITELIDVRIEKYRNFIIREIRGCDLSSHFGEMEEITGQRHRGAP